MVYLEILCQLILLLNVSESPKINYARGFLSPAGNNRPTGNNCPAGNNRVCRGELRSPAGNNRPTTNIELIKKLNFLICRTYNGMSRQFRIFIITK